VIYGRQSHALNHTIFCSSSAARGRFQEWAEAGVCLALWKLDLADYDALHGIDWAWLAMDGAMAKAPLGGKQVSKNPTDRGNIGTKRGLLTDGGVPISLAVEGANRHDCKIAWQTIASIPVERPAPIIDKPQGMSLDKIYDYVEVRDLLTAFGFLRTSGRGVRQRKPSNRKRGIRHVGG